MPPSNSQHNKIHNGNWSKIFLITLHQNNYWIVIQTKLLTALLKKKKIKTNKKKTTLKQKAVACLLKYRNDFLVKI